VNPPSVRFSSDNQNYVTLSLNLPWHRDHQQPRVSADIPRTSRCPNPQFLKNLSIYSKVYTPPEIPVLKRY
jgi:hypothetical protein